MWPKQSQADAFYGNPRGKNAQVSEKWRAANLVAVKVPFKLRYAGKPVTTVTIHRKCAESLGRVFAAIWAASGKSQATIDKWGVSEYGGTYNYRLKRNSNTLSMHAYGCAIDLAPQRYPLGSTKAKFVPEVIKAFADEGWVNLPRDRMHFQAALI
jgi:D-alanyl-D-alanine carboxypeptidase